MKLPKKIKVGNLTYTVIYTKLEDNFGIHNPGKQTITISNNMSEEMTRNVFIHELMHAIMFQIGADSERRDEILIQSLTNEIDKLFKLK